MIVTGVVPARSGVTLLARIQGNDGNLITQASISSIAYRVADVSNGTQGSSTALTVSASVYNTLQRNDPRWNMDSEDAPGADGRWGFNFEATIPRSEFPVSSLTDADTSTEDYDEPAPIQYQVDVTFTPASGQVWTAVFRLKALPVYA